MINRQFSSIKRDPVRWLIGLKLWRGVVSLLHAAVKALSGGWLELVGVAFVFFLLAVAVYSVDRARWTYPQPSLVLVLSLSIAATLVSVKVPLPDWAKHALILFTGAAVTLWQITSLPLFLPWWWEMTRQPNQTTIHFTTLMLFATWTMGYVSTWFLLRRRNPWVAIVLGAAVIVANLSNLPKAYHYFFALYVFSVVLLLGQVHLAQEHKKLSQRESSDSRRGLLYFAGVVCAIGILVASSALLLPEVRLSHFGSAIISKISIKNAEKMWLNVFAAVPGKWDILRSEREEHLFFSDPPSQSDVIQFVISAHNSDYWRTRRYHTYSSWGWTGNSTMDNAYYPGKDVFASENIRTVDVTYTVTNKLKTDVLLTTGEFKTSSVPVRLQTLEHVPAQAFSGSATEKDVISVTASRLLQPEEPYTITVSFIQVTPEDLAQADTGYDWRFAEHYLQLPETLPDRVRRLSRSVTRGARTPYDKAIAIKEYLEQLRYKRGFIQPAETADAVDYFLFEAREGDCFQFASATAVMLRSVGVPARISVGYRLTEREKSGASFVLRARDYHARAEVYFPGYGWIEFETTPGLRGLEDILPSERSSPSAESFDEMEYISGSDGTRVTAAPEAGVSPSWRRTTYLSTMVAFLSGILVLVAAGYVLYQRWLQQLRLTGDPAYIYAKMCSLASRGRAGPYPSDTPLEYGARLESTFPEQSQSIADIIRSYTQTRFSPRKDLDSVQKVKLEKSWIQLYPTLVRRVLPFRRR